VIRRLIRGLGRKDHGASIVEFAIVVPFLLLLIFGIINFGWVFHGYITLTGAAREGARLAIVGEDTSTITDAIERHARIFGDNLDIEDIDIAPEQRGETRVVVSGDLNLLVNFFPFPESIFLSATATMRQEQ